MRNLIKPSDRKEALVAEAKKLWLEEARAPPKDPQHRGTYPLPPLIDCDNVRLFLRDAQEKSKEFGPIIDQLREDLDPEQYTKRKTGRSKPKKALSGLEAVNYRLAPTDGVLENEVNLHVEFVFVPSIPDVQVQTEPGEMSWRRWLFLHCHCTFMQPHRRAGPTFQLLRRVGWWPSLIHDFNRWYWSCDCRRHRAKQVGAPLRSMLADEGRAETGRTGQRRVCAPCSTKNISNQSRERIFERFFNICVLS